MTSIHVNVSDELLLSSGHSHHVRVVDVKTGHVVRKYKSIHEDAINVSRWGNVFANVFLTCSFDRNVKLWDVRCPGRDPIYKLSSKNGNVMCCFSPDDRHFLCVIWLRGRRTSCGADDALFAVVSEQRSEAVRDGGRSVER